MKSRAIPTSFKIPESFQKEFLFEESESGFQQWVIIKGGKLFAVSRGEPTPQGSSRCMDWLEETVERVRQEVGDVR